MLLLQVRYILDGGVTLQRKLQTAFGHLRLTSARTIEWYTANILPVLVELGKACVQF